MLSFVFHAYYLEETQLRQKNGVKDLNHLDRKIEKHKTSISHLNNMLNLSMLGTVNIGLQIDNGYATFTCRHNDEVTKNRLIL